MIPTSIQKIIAIIDHRILVLQQMKRLLIREFSDDYETPFPFKLAEEMDTQERQGSNLKPGENLK